MAANQKAGGMVEELYQIYDELSAAPDKALLEGHFKKLLQAVHQGVKEKSLASQFITRFAHHFPHLAVPIVNALFDLCEEEDAGIRKQAQKDLAIVAKKLPRLVPTVADGFAQILQTDNHQELNTVQNSLMSLFYVDAQGAIQGIMAQIRTGEPIVKDRSLKFLQSKYKNLGSEVRSEEFENCLFTEIKKTIATVDSREYFNILMNILNSTAKIKSVQGQKAMVEMIEKLLNIRKDFCLSDAEEVNDDLAKLCVAVDSVFPFFHENNTSASLFIYFCTKVLPKIQHVAESNEDAYFSVLKLTVELVAYTGKLDEEQATTCLQSLIQVVEGFLLEPPPSGGAGDDEVPSYQFSFLESNFFLINKLACMQPGVFVKTVQPLKNFRDKIAYMLRASIPYTVRLRKDAKEINVDQNRDTHALVKLVSFRVLINVSGLAKVVYKAKGSFMGRMELSWKATLPPASATNSPRVARSPTRRVMVVRRSRMMGEADDVQGEGKRSQENQAGIYRPPSGKFSGAMQGYEDDDWPSGPGHPFSRRPRSRSGSRKQRNAPSRRRRY